MPIRPTIDIQTAETFVIQHENEVRPLLSFVRQQAIQAGMTILNQTQLITAASELARNMLHYADGGQARIESIRVGRKTGIRMLFIDRGPGIADVPQAMQDGYSTGTGLGLGLPGAKRLTDEFMIETAVGKGTTIIVTKWANG